MRLIDTSSWGKYCVGDLMDKLDLKVIKEDFDKRLDTSTEQTDEFSLPLINAKDGNNGIMYYGRESDFESAEMCLGVVQNGAVATGNVYAQIQNTGVLWDAYMIKSKSDISPYSLLYLSRVLQKVLKSRYSYDNKAIWEKVKNEIILLPQDATGVPDWEYMDIYMKRIETEVKGTVAQLLSIMGGGK